jgi:hypothetical protein
MGIQEIELFTEEVERQKRMLIESTAAELNS